MQDDFYQLFEGESKSPYNEATGKVDRNTLSDKLSHLNFDPAPLKNFYHFRNSYAWRQFSSNYDAYIGDRLHGGICAMQAGVPATILHADLRVKELADLFEFPSISVNDALSHGIINEVERVYTPESICKFKENYEERYDYFRSSINNIGLKLRAPVQ